MKKLLKKSVLFFTLFFIYPVVLFAQGYVLLSPTGGAGAPIDLDDTSSYFDNLFIIFISVAVILSAIRLMICGIQYMTSEAISSKAAAKQCITYVIGGLFLVLASFIVLQTINADLVGGNFDDVVSSVEDAQGDGADPVDPPVGGADPVDPPVGPGPGVDPPVSEAPVASFDVSCEGWTCTFTDTSTDPNNDISQRDWFMDDGFDSRRTGPIVRFNWPGPSPPGGYLVTLTVTDSTGLEDTIPIFIDVFDGEIGNLLPVADFSHPECDALECPFDGGTYSYDEDGIIVDYSWTIEGGPVLNGPDVIHTFPAAGSYRVTLTVTDDDGETDGMFMQVIVEEDPTLGPFNYRLEEVGTGDRVGVTSAFTIPGTGLEFDGPDFPDFPSCTAALMEEIDAGENPRFRQTFPIPWGGFHRCNNAGGGNYNYRLSETLRSGAIRNFNSPLHDNLLVCEGLLRADLLQARFIVATGGGCSN